MEPKVVLKAQQVPHLMVTERTIASSHIQISLSLVGNPIAGGIFIPSMMWPQLELTNWSKNARPEHIMAHNSPRLKLQQSKIAYSFAMTTQVVNFSFMEPKVVLKAQQVPHLMVTERTIASSHIQISLSLVGNPIAGGIFI